MRRRLLVSTVGVTVAVLLLLMFPILVILRDSAQDEEQRRLESEANRVLDVIEPSIATGNPDLVLLAAVLPADVEMELTIPGRQPVVLGPETGGDPVEATVENDDGVTLRMSSAARGIDDRLGSDIVSLGILVLVGVAAAAAFSLVQSRRLSRPFEELAVTATRLGDGDFSTPVPTDTGIEELDNIGRALQSSAIRLDQMFAAERSFTGDATHQLRTGLTGISLRLEMLAMSTDEAVRADAQAALEQTGQMNEMIDELLELARQGRAEHRVQFDLQVLVAAHVRDWQDAYAARGRSIVFRGHRSIVVATPGFAGQVVDLLLSNSLEHGAGTTLVVLGSCSVEISDDGPGIEAGRTSAIFSRPTDPGAPHGRGLPLARRLAEADGGSLELVDPAQASFRYELLRSDATIEAGPSAG